MLKKEVSKMNRESKKRIRYENREQYERTKRR